MKGAQAMLPGLERAVAFVVDNGGYAHALFSKGASKSICGLIERPRTNELKWSVVVRSWSTVNCGRCRAKFHAMVRATVELLVDDDLDDLDWHVIADQHYGDALERLCRRIAEILAEPAKIETAAEHAAALARANRDAAFVEWLETTPEAELREMVAERGRMYREALRRRGFGDAIVKTWLRELFDTLHPIGNE